MPRNKQKKEDTQPGSPAWMTTFGDMMTLLLVFFVLLFSFSVMDIEKFEGFISALQARLGVLKGGQTIVDENMVSKGSRGHDFSPTQVSLNKIMGELNQYIEENNWEDKINLEMNSRGLVIRFTGEVLYDIGKADIKPAGIKILDKIAGSIKDIENNIMVEGHTDNWPINNSKFPSNWELSTTRATNVIKYFIEKHRIKPSRLSAAGYAEYRPLKKNNTPENRAKNRRVEIVIEKIENTNTMIAE